MPVPDLEEMRKRAESSTKGSTRRTRLALFLDRSSERDHEWHRRPPRVRPRERTCLLLGDGSNQARHRTIKERGCAMRTPHLPVRRHAHSRL
jgi:hypothetical protein